jgi:hypothetical protein
MSIERIWENFIHECNSSDKKYESVEGSRHRDGSIKWTAESFKETVNVRFCPYCGIDLVEQTRSWGATDD